MLSENQERQREIGYAISSLLDELKTLQSTDIAVVDLLAFIGIHNHVPSEEEDHRDCNMGVFIGGDQNGVYNIMNVGYEQLEVIKSLIDNTFSNPSRAMKN